MKEIARISAAVVLIVAVLSCQKTSFAGQDKEKNKLKTQAGKLEAFHIKYPDSDANGDGTLSIEEATAYQAVLRQTRQGGTGGEQTDKRDITFHPGWDKGEFPEHAVFKKSPEEIKAIYERVVEPGEPVVMSFQKPEDGAYRIIGTGHSFMIPGYGTLRHICTAAGFTQRLYLHTGGGVTGSARFKWEMENGIFSFDGKPKPKLLASIANADWDVMTWGPYYKDRPEFYTCWIEFCTRFHPNMKFYLADAWPMAHMQEVPDSEDYFTEEIIDDMQRKVRETNIELVKAIRDKTVEDVYIMPTCDAMSIAAKMFLQGKLPEVEGLHKMVGNKERSIWRDRAGHLGPGFDRLEGYVFYASIYGKSPELIKNKINFPDSSEYPGEELDRIFRKIAWQAVTGHPLSGVVDEDKDGIAD
ncbi:MAG: hypothetical protein LC725_00575 [Lentisphaerae bacterium]|nr:hypothetical protein [Lentisphaerota bacterium]